MSNDWSISSRSRIFTQLTVRADCESYDFIFLGILCASSFHPHLLKLQWKSTAVQFQFHPIYTECLLPQSKPTGNMSWLFPGISFRSPVWVSKNIIVYKKTWENGPFAKVVRKTQVWRRSRTVFKKIDFPISHIDICERVYSVEMIYLATDGYLMLNVFLWEFFWRQILCTSQILAIWGLRHRFH